MTDVDRAMLPARAWNDYVDRHSEGWWWHRSEWLDYCLAYDVSSQDRSFALVRDGVVRGICPAVLSDGRIQTGDDPCPGPLTDDVSVLINTLQRRLGGIPKRWRWNSGVESSSVVKALLRCGYVSSGWDTCVVELADRSVCDLWDGIRKSYRSVIRRGEREYLILSNDEGLWKSYEDCHRSFGSRERPALTYVYQREWVKNHVGYIVAAFSKGGSNGDGRSVVASPSLGFVDGSRPSPSAGSVCRGASLSFVYKNHAYYASGPSLVGDLQHCLQWKTLTDLRSMGVRSYEMGWVNHMPDQKGIEFFKRGFGGVLRRVDAVSSND